MWAPIVVSALGQPFISAFDFYYFVAFSPTICFLLWVHRVFSCACCISFPVKISTPNGSMHLPIHLPPHFPTQQAVVAVLGATPLARLVDHTGAERVLIPALTIISSAI